MKNYRFLNVVFKKDPSLKTLLKRSLTTFQRKNTFFWSGNHWSENIQVICLEKKTFKTTFMFFFSSEKLKLIVFINLRFILVNIFSKTIGFSKMIVFRFFESWKRVVRFQKRKFFPKNESIVLGEKNRNEKNNDRFLKTKRKMTVKKRLTTL